MTLINTLINSAVKKVSMEYLWNDLLVTGTGNLTIGLTTFTLASDHRRMAEFRVLDGLSSYRMRVMKKTFVVTLYPDITVWANGKPRIGYIQGLTLHFTPPSDTAYPVNYSYYRLHPALVNDAALLLITQADEAVIAYTVYRLFKSIEKHEDAAVWAADYAVHLKDAISVDGSPATEIAADPRGRGRPVPEDFWINPFVHSTPGYGGGYGYGYGYGYGHGHGFYYG